MDVDKILNPLTGRYVLKTGKIGKELLKNNQEPVVKKEKTVKKPVDKKEKTVKKPVDKKEKAVKKPVDKKEKPVKKPVDKKETVDKIITINELKSEWMKIYEKSTPSLTFDINQSKDNLLDIRLSKTAKVIGLAGNGTLFLRKIKDIALANNQRTDIYLPKNYTGKHYANPLWNRVHGYMYYLNEYNIKIISQIVYTINEINAKYKSYKISDSVATEENKTHGIIGIDILYTEPKWVSDIIKGNPLQNPILNENGQIIFSKCAISTKTIEKANVYLQNKMPKEFKTLYPKYINIRSTKAISKELTTFIESDYTIANIAYSKHARTIFKNGGKLYIIDPWKQSADAGTKDLIKIVPSLSFIKRKQEQTTEGSCTAVSYARTLYMAMQGVDKINEQIPLDYIVLASRLISKFRT